uniref:Polymerase acidic protein n=1 Tax=Chum salmon influenza-like virus TaxID=2777032 RepID=A0A866VZ23_9ORTO|nr:polymerase acidic protein [Chum salmon influenza-like virus]
MEQFIMKNFLSSNVEKARKTMEEFDEIPENNLGQLYNICVHLEACYIVSNMNYLDTEGKKFVAVDGQGKQELLKPQYEILEGMPRGIAWAVQRAICDQLELEVPKYLGDLFDYTTNRFLEIGVTKGVSEDYFQRKKEKLGNSMDIIIFSYGGDISTSNGYDIDEESKGRVLTRLLQLQNELSSKNLWSGILEESGLNSVVSFELPDTILRLRDESMPTGEMDYEIFRGKCSLLSFGGSIAAKLGMMSDQVNATPKLTTWSDVRPLAEKNLYEGEPVEYNSLLLLSDGLGLSAASDGSTMRPSDLSKKILMKHLSAVDTEDMVMVCRSEKANTSYLWQIWKEVRRNILTEDTLTVTKSPAAKWATGDSLTYERVGSKETKEDASMRQEDTIGPEKRKPAAWVQIEMNNLSQLTNKRALDLPELPPSVSPIEDVGETRRGYFMAEVKMSKAATIMMKLVRFYTYLLTECSTNMSNYRAVPISNRVENIGGGFTDQLYGFGMKGQSHLRADTDVVSLCTMEFSLTDPTIDPKKWKKYTVFKLGMINMGGIGKYNGRQLYLYMKVTGTNKIKMKWGMEARRCILQAMQQMESMVDQASAIAGKDQTKAFFEGDGATPGREMTVGKNEEGIQKGSFGKSLRVLLAKCLMHFVWGDAQLEGFSAETRRLMLIIQALKDERRPYTFDMEGLYKGINECIINNPYVLQSAVWFNDWVAIEKERVIAMDF